MFDKNPLSLKELYIYEPAEIVSVNTTSQLGKKLRDMGLWEGAIITMVSYDPVITKKCVIKIGETQIAFDSELAELIEVRPIKSWYAFYKEQAFYDNLTGCLNRNCAFIALSSAYEKAQINKYPLSLILIDLDDFKRINDTYGHDIGDKLLAEVGLFLRRNVRRTDMVFRWGGDEFLILMEGLNFKNAFLMADRLCSCAKHIELKPVGKGVITLSAGVDGAPPYDHLDKLLDRCDKALYLAKNKGKNQVCTFFWRKAYEIS